MLDEHVVVNDVGYLMRQAERCARLAASIDDCQASAVLETMAEEFERMASGQRPAAKDEPLVSGQSESVPEWTPTNLPAPP